MAKNRAKKQKKKRSKKYHGEDAINTNTVVKRVKAEHKGPLESWWNENKLHVYSRGLTIALALVIGLLLFLVFSLIF